jgi:hypothetical protein
VRSLSEHTLVFPVGVEESLSKHLLELGIDAPDLVEANVTEPGRTQPLFGPVPALKISGNDFRKMLLLSAVNE